MALEAFTTQERSWAMNASVLSHEKGRTGVSLKISNQNTPRAGLWSSRGWIIRQISACLIVAVSAQVVA